MAMGCIADRIWRVPGTIPALTAASREVGEWLSAQGLRPRVPYVVQLVVEELGTNIVKYGYDSPPPHEFQVHVAIGADAVRVSVEDDGHPFDPFARPARPVEEVLETCREGGLGIELVRQVCRSCRYRREGGLNRVDLEIARRLPDDELDAMGALDTIDALEAVSRAAGGGPRQQKEGKV